MYETKPYFYGTGRRKDSVARVRVYAGTGKITVNDRELDNYFGLETLKLIVRAPLVLLGVEDKFDVVVRVNGGGVSGQAGAIRHGISRAMLQQSDENRAVLKKAGYRLPDPRSSHEGAQEVRPQGCPPRSPVLQALIFPKKFSKKLGKTYLSGLFLFDMVWRIWKNLVVFDLVCTAF